MIAAGYNCVDSLRVLLDDSRPDPATNDSASLKIAARYGFLPIVQMLVEDDRADPGAQDHYCLFIAVENQHGPVVEYLLHQQAASLDLKHVLRIMQGIANKKLYAIMPVVFKNPLFQTLVNVDTAIEYANQRGADEMIHYLETLRQSMPTTVENPGPPIMSEQSCAPSQNAGDRQALLSFLKNMRHNAAAQTLTYTSAAGHMYTYHKKKMLAQGGYGVVDEYHMVPFTSVLIDIDGTPSEYPIVVNHFLKTRTEKRTWRLKSEFYSDSKSTTPLANNFEWWLRLFLKKSRINCPAL